MFANVQLIGVGLRLPAGGVSYGSKSASLLLAISTAPSESLSETLLFRWSVPLKYLPAGNTTTPPRAEARSIASCNAEVSLAIPSPLAPNSYTS